MDEDDRNNLCHSIAERYVDTLFERMGAGDVDMVECLQLAKEAVQNNIFTLQWHDRELTSGEQECLLAKCERYVLYFEEISSKLAEDVWARKYASSLGQASNSGGSGYGQGLLRKDKAVSSHERSFRGVQLELTPFLYRFGPSRLWICLKPWRRPLQAHRLPSSVRDVWALFALAPLHVSPRPGGSWNPAARTRVDVWMRSKRLCRTRSLRKSGVVASSPPWSRIGFS